MRRTAREVARGGRARLLDVVRLVEDEDVAREIDVERPPRVRVDQVVVRHEEHLGRVLELARVVEGAELALLGDRDEVLDVGELALALGHVGVGVGHRALSLLEHLQLLVVAAALRGDQRLARAVLLRAAAQPADVGVDAHLLARAEHADARPVHGPPQLAHHLLQLRVRARRVHDPRRARRHRAGAGRRSAVAGGRRLHRACPHLVGDGGGRRRVAGPQPLRVRAAPAERSAQQAERLPRPCRALEQRVAPVLESEHHLLHVCELHRVRVEREVDLHAGDRVDGHFCALPVRPPRAEGGTSAGAAKGASEVRCVKRERESCEESRRDALLARRRRNFSCR